eukprot:RCo022717
MGPVLEVLPQRVIHTTVISLYTGEVKRTQSAPSGAAVTQRPAGDNWLDGMKPLPGVEHDKGGQVEDHNGSHSGHDDSDIQEGHSWMQGGRIEAAITEKGDAGEAPNHAVSDRKPEVEKKSNGKQQRKND